MKVMLLAAGRGSRMGKLTENVPKPLLQIGGKPLIQHHIEKFAAIGIKEFVVNLWYLGDKIREFLGDGSQFKVKITYSPERELLGMGGGVKQALKFLGSEFIVMSNDVWTDYPFETLFDKVSSKAHVVLVDNPPFHPTGDFSLEGNLLVNKAKHTYNYAGFGIFHADIFDLPDQDSFGIMPVLQPLVDAKEATAEHYAGAWFNLNTPEDLQIVKTIVNS